MLKNYFQISPGIDLDYFAELKDFFSKIFPYSLVLNYVVLMYF